MPDTGHYTVKKMDKGIWCIGEEGVHMYLVEGSRQALLIDTGFGRGDLTSLVATLTDRPVAVVNTHAHPDHEGGNAQFARVHLHSADLHLSRFRDGPCALVQVGEGFIFHLGDRSLMVLENPGHTPGSISLWDPQAGVLFSGDSLGANTHWLFLPESLPMGVYRRSIQQYRGMSDTIRAIYPGHDNTPVGAEYIVDLLECIGEILEDPKIGKPYESFAGCGLYHKTGNVSIAYDSAKAH